MAVSNVLGDSFSVANGSITKDFNYSVTIPEDLNTENLKVLVICQKSFDKERKTTGDYGDYYVDNSFYGNLGMSASVGGTENVNIGEDINATTL